MPRHKTITDAAAKRFKVGKGQIDHFDSSHPGLHLRVSHTGRKAWNYVYRIGGKQTRIQLDLYPTMSVEEAHDAWRKARDAVRAGRSPATKVAAVDFTSVYEEWLQRDQAKNRSLRQTKRFFERCVLPRWQHRPITEIGRRDCLDLIDALADQGKFTAARRLHGLLHRLFRWAIGRGIVEINPLNGVDRPGAEIKRERALSDAELAKVWTATERVGFPYGSALQLLILTAARRDEIGRLRWAEIDNSAIKLEGSRTKNGEPKDIPLSTPAHAILDKLPRIGEFVFTSSGKRPVSDWSQAKSDLDRFSAVTKPWRIHDLRRTVSTGMNELGTEPHIVEAVLGHTIKGIAGVYNRAKYEAAKRAALEAWGAHVMALVRQ